MRGGGREVVVKWVASDVVEDVEETVEAEIASKETKRIGRNVRVDRRRTRLGRASVPAAVLDDAVAEFFVVVVVEKPLAVVLVERRKNRRS